MFKKHLMMGASLCALAPLAALAGDPVVLPEVVAEGEAENPQRIELFLEGGQSFPHADGGEYLQSVPGVTGSRMGGHGIDPFIRGQKQTQLNIIDDGVVVHGGCPNRMDPPASYLSLEGNDQLIVEKGYSSVQNGSGGSGGTVRTIRGAPVFEDGKSVNVSLSGGYESNGDNENIAIKSDVRLGDGYYVRGNLERNYGQSYVDGNGKGVRAGHTQHGGRIDLGITPNIDTKLTVGVQLDDTRDVLFAGAAMDAPESQMKAMRASLDQNVDLGMFSKITASGFISSVDHVMDNFTLRDRVGMGMLTESDTRVLGGSVSATNDDTTVGVDVKRSDFDALRYMGAQTNIYATGNDHAYMWPGVDMTQIGLFGEHTVGLDAKSKVKVGLRYDYVGVDATKVNTVSSRTNRTPNQVYQMYYGTTWDNQNEHNIGGLLRFDHDYTQNLNLFASVSRVVRTADVSERSMAADHATASNRWVGNPNISPEQHHQMELGGTATYDAWNLGGSVYYNKVTDYILRDNATAQSGILLNDNADIYRNISATLMGFELAGGYDLTDKLNMSANVAYTYGENNDDNRPLAQIAPMEYGLATEYSEQNWLAGVRLRGAAKQHRADIGAVTSGQDTEKTGGYTVFDLYGNILAFDVADVSLGVTNVFDKTYSNHLNRSSSFDNEVTKVNEPGRSFFVQVNAKF